MEELKRLLELYNDPKTTDEQKAAIKYYLDGVASSRAWIEHLLKLIEWGIIK